MKTIIQTTDGTVCLHDDGIDWSRLNDFDREVVLALASNNMNETETARQLYAHRNTVCYHLRKVKKLTGLDPVNFYDLHKLVQHFNGEG